MGDLAPGLSADLPDRYEVVRVHGRGGMATVYLAIDRKHDRQVALKVLASELAAGIGAERFVREIQIAAHLNHPHIVPLLDSGIANGRPFYVMPFVEGDSLRERLGHEGPLPLENALRIAGDVAEALAYAHDRGVVHRDIKPGNILLTGGAAVVTDFGIAAAIDRAPEDCITRTGHSLGSVGYMSPEQASGDDDVDGRADQYSLACVLFEMLAGRRPYEGSTARAVLGKQLSMPVPSVANFRDSVPGHIEEAVRRALSPAPSDRHPDIGTFGRCLTGASVPGASGRTHILRLGTSHPFRSVAIGLSVVLTLVVAAWVLPRLDEHLLAGAETAQVDTTRYAIFAFYDRSGSRLELSEQERIRLALADWGGISISVVESPQLQEEVRRTGHRPLTPTEAAKVARAQGAGRMILGAYSVVDDSLSIDAGLYDSTGKELYRASRRIAESGDLNAAFGSLVNDLLFRGSPPGGPDIVVGTRSYPALRAFHFGSLALESWDLARAETNFKLAADLDPDFGRAHLWLALSRAWSDQPSARWQIPSIQADLHREGMTDRDSVMVDAVMAQASGDYGDACALWRGLTESQPKDYAGWYGLAICLVSDEVVVRDSTSPSRWRFRSSRHEAIVAYRRAFGLLPAILESFHSNSYASLQRLFFLAGNTARAGRAAGSTTLRFRARPGWSNDTLRLVPYPLNSAADQPDYDSRENEVAVRELRRLFVDVARAWTASSPRNSRAVEALAVGLGMLGDPAAVDTIVRARSLAATSEEELEVAGTEVWLRLAFALPGQPNSLRRVRALADSILDSGPEPIADTRLAAGLAAVTGRVNLAASYARRLPRDHRSALSPTAQADGRALLMFASFGGPADSLEVLERRVRLAVERLPEDKRTGEYGTWLALPASVAFPSYRFATAEIFAFDRLVAAQLAAESGDVDKVRATLGAIARNRASSAPHHLTLDALFPEAHLYVAVDDVRAAADWLDPTLHSLPQMSLGTLSTPHRVACLLHAAALRARIASRLSDERTARAWARSVRILWGEAEAPLHEVTSRMEAVTGDTPPP